jgi:hypothetical protein
MRKRVFWTASLLFVAILIVTAVVSGEYGVLFWLVLPVGAFGLVFLEDLLSRLSVRSKAPGESTPDHIRRYEEYVPNSSTTQIWPPPGPSE